MDNKYLRAFATIHEEGTISKKLHAIAKNNGIHPARFRATMKIVVRCLQKEVTSQRKLDHKFEQLATREITSIRIKKLLKIARGCPEIYLESEIIKKLLTPKRKEKKQIK